MIHIIYIVIVLTAIGWAVCERCYSKSKERELHDVQDRMRRGKRG